MNSIGKKRRPERQTGPTLSPHEQESMRAAGGKVLAEVQKHGHVVVQSRRYHTEALVSGIIRARRAISPESTADSVTFITKSDVENPAAYRRLIARLDDFRALPENNLLIVKNAEFLRAQTKEATDLADGLNQYLVDMPREAVQTVTFDTSPWRHSRRVPSQHLLNTSVYLDTVTVGIDVADDGGTTLRDPLQPYAFVPSASDAGEVPSIAGNWFQFDTPRPSNSASEA